jgi:hypothetical protein
MTIEARPTGTGKGSVNRKTQFGMMKSKPNKKYKCSCEDIQRKILVKYLIDFCLKSLILSTILITIPQQHCCNRQK